MFLTHESNKDTHTLEYNKSAEALWANQQVLTGQLGRQII